MKTSQLSSRSMKLTLCQYVLVEILPFNFSTRSQSHFSDIQIGLGTRLTPLE